VIANEPGDHVDAFIARALDSDVRGAVTLVLQLLDGGVPGELVISELLAAAQRQIGERWQRNELGVADEHLATGAAESALHALARTGSGPDSPGLVVVACAEGDWHGIAAHMFAEQLRARGLGVTFLGASTPADHVETFIRRRQPDALAVSCNLPIFFPGLARLADAAHAQGVPVLAGGRALGDSSERALRLGADEWADNIDDAATVLTEWHGRRPSMRKGSIDLDEDALALDARAPELASIALDDLASRLPAMASYDSSQLTRTREDLAFIVRFVAAAQLVDDQSVLIEFLDWLYVLLEARGVPKEALIAGLDALLPLLSAAGPAAAALADIGRDHLAASTTATHGRG
jgi:methanogenic corrinoid protein MtbC1